MLTIATFPDDSKCLGTIEVAANTTNLAAIVRDAAEGTTIVIAPGTYELSAPLEPKAGMTLKGAGMGMTIITHTADRMPSTTTLPDPEVTIKGMDTHAYLLRLTDKADAITLSNMTLRGPQMHGAIYGWGNTTLHLHHLQIEDTLLSSSICRLQTIAILKRLL